MSLDHSDEVTKIDAKDSEQNLSQEQGGTEKVSDVDEDVSDEVNESTKNKAETSKDTKASEEEKNEHLLQEEKEEEAGGDNEGSSDQTKESSESGDSIDVNKNTDSENEEDLTYVCRESLRSELSKKCSETDENENLIRPENIHSEIQMLQNKIDAIRARQATLKEETQFLVKQFDELLEHYRQMGGEVLDLSDISI